MGHAVARIREEKFTEKWEESGKMAAIRSRRTLGDHPPKTACSRGGNPGLKLGAHAPICQLMSSQDEQETLKDFSRKSCRGRSSSDRNHPPRPLSQALSLLINDLLDVPPHCPLLSTTVTHSEDPEAAMSSYLISVASRRLTDANLSTALSA